MRQFTVQEAAQTLARLTVSARDLRQLGRGDRSRRFLAHVIRGVRAELRRACVREGRIRFTIFDGNASGSRWIRLLQEPRR